MKMRIRTEHNGFRILEKSTVSTTSNGHLTALQDVVTTYFCHTFCGPTAEYLRPQDKVSRKVTNGVSRAMGHI